MNPDECIVESIELLSGTLRNNIRITHRKAIPSVSLKGDATQLQQVFLNLALNAQDAMPDGGDLVFETAVRAEDGEVSISVRDTGTGMTPEVRARIFEPFVTTKPEGMGMGLAVARSLIDNHGGSIRAVNQPGGGAVVTISLPGLSATA